MKGSPIDLIALLSLLFLSLKTCNEAFVMRGIRMQMPDGLLRYSSLRNDVDLTIILVERNLRFQRRFKRHLIARCRFQIRLICNFSFIRYDKI